jgi:hypothetical protein
VTDVAIFYGEGSGDPHRHEQRSLRLAASNGYRVPLGGSGLHTTLRTLRPEVVLLHDPFWTPRHASRIAHALGAVVIAVHHSSAALQAAGLPGPQGVYAHALRRWLRRAYTEVDAVMSVVDTDFDAHRPATLRLRLGLDPAFGPRPEIERQDHVLYVGRQEQPSFTPGFSLWRCWRGPSWVNTAWLLVPAMWELGYGEEAERIVASLARAAARSGFREYYNPHSGRGLAALGFGFSTLLVDLLVQAHGEPSVRPPMMQP